MKNIKLIPCWICGELEERVVYHKRAICYKCRSARNRENSKKRFLDKERKKKSQ